MTDKESGALGPMELEVTFVPRKGGDAARAVTTPSMWARADEWLDSFVYGSDAQHSDGWLADKLLGAICLLAAEQAGLMRRGPMTLERIWEMRNLYDPQLPESEQAREGGANPTGGPGA